MSRDTPIGELRTRLTLEAQSRAGDGGADIAWQTVAEVWGEVRPTSGEERYELDRVAGRCSHEIIIRHRADVVPQMRLREGTRVFDIRAAFDPDQRRHWLKILAEERDL